MSEHQPSSSRRTLPRSAALVGASLSALAVVYASTLLGAIVGAVIFFVFYRQLGPARGTIATTVTPTGPFRAPTSTKDHHRAA